MAAAAPWQLVFTPQVSRRRSLGCHTRGQRGTRFAKGPESLQGSGTIVARPSLLTREGIEMPRGARKQGEGLGRRGYLKGGQGTDKVPVLSMEEQQKIREFAHRTVAMYLTLCVDALIIGKPSLDREQATNILTETLITIRKERLTV